MKRIDGTTAEGRRALAVLMSRTALDQETEREAVRAILVDVRQRGDAAVLAYTARFDGATLTADRLEVTRDEMERAWEAVPPGLLEVMERAADNIRAFHALQMRPSIRDEQPGRLLGQRVLPLSRVGVYAPGGRALYPSSVLMDAIPARAAGVPEIILCTPPRPDGGVGALTLAAARIAGVDRVFRVGGAQAIGAMAWGTATIPRVDKIVGPGNIYVALAKREVFGYVGIDMVAGPSEVLVIADESANPRWVAADLLSQAEHDPLAAAILVSPDAALIEAVAAQLNTQSATLPRASIVREALANCCALVRVDTLDDAVCVANDIAPEHLELAVADPEALLARVRNAGAVFLGHFSPEPLGDYFAGPNHVLPTSGTARFFSPLSVDDFVKRSSVIGYSREALRSVYRDIAVFARAEGLEAHARAALVRFEEESQ
ncbi:MAG: histidinol dehydrogenase [Christensenellales bacterium]|jgi:histidinol dehydrogenase